MDRDNVIELTIITGNAVPTTAPSGGGLSGGAIAGIVIAALLFLGLIFGGGTTWKKKADQAKAAATHTTSTVTEERNTNPEVALETINTSVVPISAKVGNLLAMIIRPIHEKHFYNSLSLKYT